MLERGRTMNHTWTKKRQAINFTRKGKDSNIANGLKDKRNKVIPKARHILGHVMEQIETGSYTPANAKTKTQRKSGARATTLGR